MKINSFWERALLGLGVVLLIAAVAAPSHGSAEGSFDRTLKVTGPVQLDVSTGSGSIRVRPGSAGSVHVVGTIRAHDGWSGGADDRVRRLEANPPIEQNGNIIRIGHIEDEDLKRNISISYELEVPAETQVRSESGSGSQEVRGLTGPVKAQTGSGSITVSGIKMEVQAHTGSGSISLESIGASVQLHTGSGSIRAHDIHGRVNAQTGSGNIMLDQSAPGDVEAETGSGHMELRNVHGTLRAETGSGGIDVDGQPTGDWKLEAGSGGIRVQLPADAAFDFRAHTGSGGITIDHPLTIQGTVSRSDLQGRVRGGGYLLEVRTGSGHIEVR
jgi:urease beta subunit